MVHVLDMVNSTDIEVYTVFVIWIYIILNKYETIKNVIVKIRQNLVYSTIFLTPLRNVDVKMNTMKSTNILNNTTYFYIVEDHL